MASINYFDSYSTNIVVHFDEKGNDLCLRLWARSCTIYVIQIGCSIFYPAKFKQTITPQHVLLQQSSLIGGTAVTIILCFHIFINFWICRLFSVNIDVLITSTTLGRNMFDCKYITGLFTKWKKHFTLEFIVYLFLCVL